jgi:hypothetical protein
LRPGQRHAINSDPLKLCAITTVLMNSLDRGSLLQWLSQHPPGCENLPEKFGAAAILRATILPAMDQRVVHNSLDNSLDILRLELVGTVRPPSFP